MAALTSRLREDVRALDPNLPVYRVAGLEQVMNEANWNSRLAGGVLGIVGAIAVSLSAVGLFAVTSQAVAQRTREIGIRMALGARGSQVVWMVLRRALWQLSLGLLAGAGCVFAYDRAFGPAPHRGLDLSIVLPAAALLLAVTALACISPAARAAHLNPVATLRRD